MVDHSKKVTNPSPPPKYPDVLPAPIIMENDAEKEGTTVTAASPQQQQQNRTAFRERSVKTDCGDNPYKEQQQKRGAKKKMKRQKRENRKR